MSMTHIRFYGLFALVFSVFIGCAGLKVVDPEADKDKGTMQLDTSGGGFKFVATYTCKLNSGGKKYSALGKSEAEARAEVVARCRDGSLISNCKAEEATCKKN
jgi:hypothetical protein